MASPERKKYTCIICAKKSLDETEMTMHMQSAHAPEEVTCPLCCFSCHSEKELTLHVNSSHLDVISPVKSPTSRGYSQVTHKPYSSSPRHNSHRSGSDRFQTVYECPVCIEFKCDSSQVLYLHMEQSHFMDDQPPENPKTSVDDQNNNASDNSKISIKNFNNEEQPQRSIFTEQNIRSSDSDIEDKTSIPKTDDESLNITKNSESVEVRRESMNESLLGCTLCDLNLPEGVTLEEHLNECHAEEAISDQQGSLLRCPMCDEPSADAASLQKHVDHHFQEEESLALIKDEAQRDQEYERRQRYAAAYHAKEAPPTSKHPDAKKQKTVSKSKVTASQNGGRRQMSILDFCDKENKGVPAVSKVLVDDGGTSTRGIIEKLQYYYRDKVGKNLNNVWLASPTDHFSGSYSDRGWGCGYRNFQMALSCLIKDDAYRKVVFGGQADMPSVGKVQHIIEDAWAAGFDPQGRLQLNGTLVDTRKWIGATEIVAAFSSLKVRCQLIDFYRPTGPDGTHPRLFEWARDYFKGDGFRPPLYLQHQGHSRTIVGVEEGRNGKLTLLIFDPGTPRSQMQQFIRNLITPRLMQVVRRLPSGIKAKQYQVVAVRGLLSDAEQQNYKLVRSDRVP